MNDSLNYTWIITKHYKDAYEPISIMECHESFLITAHVSCFLSTPPQKIDALLYTGLLTIYFP